MTSKFQIVNISIPVVNTYNWLYGDDCSICFNNINIYNPEEIVNKNLYLDPKIICSITNFDYNKFNVGICGHIYHKKCIELWLKNNTKCPNCRTIWKLKK